MSLNQLRTLYKGRHFYEVLLLDARTQEACAKIKPSYVQCWKNSPGHCFDKFREYEHDCRHKRYKSQEFQEFSRIVENVANKRMDYLTYEVRIRALYMGPVFLKNDFVVYFDSEGKVKSITTVTHWD